VGPTGKLSPFSYTGNFRAPVCRERLSPSISADPGSLFVSSRFKRKHPSFLFSPVVSWPRARSRWSADATAKGASSHRAPQTLEHIRPAFTLATCRTAAAVLGAQSRRRLTEPGLAGAHGPWIMCSPHTQGASICI